MDKKHLITLFILLTSSLIGLSQEANEPNNQNFDWTGVVGLGTAIFTLLALIIQKFFGLKKDIKEEIKSPETQALIKEQVDKYFAEERKRGKSKNSSATYLHHKS